MPSTAHTVLLQAELGFFLFFVFVCLFPLLSLLGTNELGKSNLWRKVLLSVALTGDAH